MASLLTAVCVFFSLVVPQTAISASPRMQAASTHNVGEPLLNWRGFVINMETAPERLQSFWADAVPQPWFRESFCRFRAVNGHDPAVLEDLMAKHHFPGFNDSAIQDAIHEPGSDLVEHFSTGAVALYESHLQIMRIIAADPTIDFGVIAEDDLALYSDDFKMQFNKLMDNQQGAAAKFWQDTDLVYLQACNQGWNRSSYRDPMGERVLPREDMATNFEDVSKEIVYCTALYAVSKEGAKKTFSRRRTSTSNYQAIGLGAAVQSSGDSCKGLPPINCSSLGCRRRKRINKYTDASVLEIQVKFQPHS